MTPRIRFDQSICSDPASALEREWLETNGIGGFASSTLCGANTRRYHGLLIAAATPPSGRSVLLSKFEETLVVGDERFELSTNLYPGVTHPAGYRYLTGFRLDPFPVFTFEAGGVRIEKRLCLVNGEDTLALGYEVTGKPCRLELRPLLACRGYHELMHSGVAWNGAFTESGDAIAMQPRAGYPELHFAHAAQRVAREGNWYFNFEYPLERERGFDFHEDLYCPFVLDYRLEPGERAELVVSTAPGHRASDAPALRAAECSRRAALNPGADRFDDHFLVRRAGGWTILAGYPWFGEWCRDTMISLPGLTLINGRFDVARSILREAVRWLDRGMLPNRFPDGAATPEYNTVDATLWLFEAARKLLDCTGDLAFLREQLYAPLRDVIDWHVRGTRYGIAMDADGLLLAGDASTQLTWMDARVDGRPVTPRHGKAVEIQALWYNALRFMAALAAELDDAESSRSYTRLADQARSSIRATFWNEAAGCLFDVVNGNQRDASVRPNQLIALSLGYCALETWHALSILRVAEASLVTPFGLRTLAPDDPRYCGRYEGGPAQRDGAYHQGTVWPWLLGPYLTAEARFNGAQGKAKAAAILSAISEFVLTRGTGLLPEIFDGDPPHEPRGCIAQAWSAAELERVAAENFIEEEEVP